MNARPGPDRDPDGRQHVLKERVAAEQAAVGADRGSAATVATAKATALLPIQ